LKYKRATAVFLTALAACGPDAQPESEWIVGTFSNVPGGVESRGVWRFTFDRDGAVELERLENCGGVEDPWSGRWIAETENRVRTEPNSDDDPPDDQTQGYFIERRGDCGPYELHDIREGTNPIPPQELFNAPVCLRELPSCAPSQCVGCEAVWCDEEPSCDEEP
jgi:hypothetical protein